MAGGGGGGGVAAVAAAAAAAEAEAEGRRRAEAAVAALQSRLAEVEEAAFGHKGKEDEGGDEDDVEGRQAAACAAPSCAACPSWSEEERKGRGRKTWH